MKGKLFSRILLGVAALCLILAALVEPTAAQGQTVKLGGTLPPGYTVTQVTEVGAQAAIKGGLLVDSNYYDSRVGGIATYVNAFVLEGTAIIAVQPEDGFPWVFYPLGSGYLFTGGPTQRVKLLRTSVAVDGTITVLGQIAGFFQSSSTDDCQAINLATGLPDGALAQALYDPDWNGMGRTEGSLSGLGGHDSFYRYSRGGVDVIPFDEVLNGLQGMYVYAWTAWIEANNLANGNLCASMEWDWSLLQDATPTPTPTTTPSAVSPSPTPTASPTATQLPPTATPTPTWTPTPNPIGCVGYCVFLPLIAAGGG